MDLINSYMHTSTSILMDEYTPKRKQKKIDLYSIQSQVVQEIILSDYLFNKSTKKQKDASLPILIIQPPQQPLAL